MDLHIIVKTCDSNTLNPLPRICEEKKIDIINKCLTSVVLSAGQCNKSIKLTVVDDASSKECVELIKKILKNSYKETELITREKNNFKEATLQTFELAKNSDSTLVYCVEDDYLHEPNSIQEMMDFYDFAFKQLNKAKDIILCPHDDPTNYSVRFYESSHIVLGQRRHWRTNSHTLCTFMATPGLIRRNWEYFFKFSKEFSNEISEQNTIDAVWNFSTSQLFSPIPSVAFHLHDDDRCDKLVNWKSLWEIVPDITKQ